MLTHAHLDHCGYLPRLVAQGFKGRIFCTPGTRDLCTLVLPDSAHIQEEDARDGESPRLLEAHAGAAAVHGARCRAALTQLQPVGYDRPVPVVPGVDVEFINAGHLLGSAYARLRVGGKTILFGGDLGRYGRPVLPDPLPVDARRHAARRIDLRRSRCTARRRRTRGWRRSSTTTVQRGGKLIMPSFAIGRVEEVIYWLKRLEEQKRIPVLPVYVDSPMAAGRCSSTPSASTSSIRT